MTEPTGGGSSKAASEPLRTTPRHQERQGRARGSWSPGSKPFPGPLPVSTCRGNSHVGTGRSPLPSQVSRSPRDWRELAGRGPLAQVSVCLSPAASLRRGSHTHNPACEASVQGRAVCSQLCGHCHRQRERCHLLNTRPHTRRGPDPVPTPSCCALTSLGRFLATGSHRSERPAGSKALQAPALQHASAPHPFSWLHNIPRNGCPRTSRWTRLLPSGALTNTCMRVSAWTRLSLAPPRTPPAVGTRGHS